jgi:hypothetical protein
MDSDDEDFVYPTSPKRLFMMRALALGLGVLMLLILVFALAL